jgi:hypothetical protein
MCATVSWGAHESFMYPIFVLKNGCDTKGFIMEEKERKGCHLKKQIESLGFKENEKDNSVYAKFKNGKFIFHILCIDD